MDKSMADLRGGLFLSALWVCAATIAGVPVTAAAQQWVFEPNFSVAAEYNDNLRLNRDNQEQLDTASASVDAEGRFVRRTPISELRIAPRVRALNYFDSEAEDTTDLFLDLFGNRDMQRGRFGMQVRLSRESVQTAEIDDPDFDNPDVEVPVDLDTGRVRIDNDRDTIIVGPYFQHELSETLALRLDGQYVDVAYDDSETGLVDYDSATLGADLIFRQTERSSWSIRTFVTDYGAETTDAENESETIGARIGFNHQFTETMEGNFSAGYENVDTDITLDGVLVSETEDAALFSAGLTRRSELSRTVIEASQSIDPSGVGVLQKKLQLRMRYRRQLSPTLFGSFDARVMTAEELSDVTGRVERDYQRYGLGLEKALSQKWSIEANYSFTIQEYSDEDESASSNAVLIRLLYRPPSRRR